MTEFDYVIVGGGSAGCVLANRLTEDSNVNVCLLETGPADKTPLIHVPAMFAFLPETNIHINMTLHLKKNLMKSQLPKVHLMQLIRLEAHTQCPKAIKKIEEDISPEEGL